MSDYHPQTSPRTDAGKTRSSQNATTHGATSQQLILPGESQQDFDNLLSNLTQEFQPSTDQGHGYVYDAARARWDLWRKQRIYDQVSADIHFHQTDPTQWDAETFHRLHLLDRYKTAAERAFKRAISNVELLRKLNFTEQDREMRRVRWDQVQEAKQAGLKLTSIKKEMELTKVTDEAYRRACNGYGKPSFVQNIEIEVMEGRTYTMPDLDNQFILEYLDMKHTYQPEDIVRKYHFPQGIPPEYHYMTDREDYRNEKHHTIEESFTVEEFRLLAAAEEKLATGHFLSSPSQVA